VQVAHVLGDAAFGARLALSLGVAMVGIALIVRAAVLDRQQGDLLRRLRERERELAEANLRLNEESRRDTLTGLGNRLRLREDFVDLAAGMQRHGRAYCLILFDLDRFKDYNDGLGHQAGDLALRRVAALLETRAGDAIYRYGGEELLLVIREQDARTALEVAERHRARVEKAALPHPHNAPVGVVTMSGGVAVARSGDTPDEVLRRADRALYASKAQGRNRITVAATPQGKVPDVPSQLQPGSATA
jgi:diguanylate cyclase (GGDEF)-like protein